MKIRKKTLDALQSILNDWHGSGEAENVLAAFHPQPIGIDSLLDKIITRALPPWERKFNEIRLSWKQLAGNEIARRCRVSHLNEGILYIEVFHPAYRIALDTPKIKNTLLEKARYILGTENCRELKFIPVGRSGGVEPRLNKRMAVSPSPAGSKKEKNKYTPDLPF